MNEVKITGGFVRPPLHKILVALSILATVSAALTGIMSWANLGFSSAFLANWGKTFAMAILFMMPVLIVLMGVVTKVIESMFSSFPDLSRKIGIALILSIIMQSIMASLTAMNAVGFSSAVYWGNWSTAFTTAFPFGLATALLMVLVIRPRLLLYLMS